MGCRAVVLLGLVVATLLLISEVAAARNLQAETSTEKKNAEASTDTKGVADTGTDQYPPGGVPRGYGYGGYVPPDGGPRGYGGYVPPDGGPRGYGGYVPPDGGPRGYGGYVPPDGGPRGYGGYPPGGGYGPPRGG